MLFFGRKKRLIDFASVGRVGKLPEGLLEALRNSPQEADPNRATGVYKLTDELALVQSVDFFSPLVNDPFLYGQIAAANALGDVYALGATPRTALYLVGYPDDKDPEVTWLVEMMHGGAERLQAAGASVVGGHTVRDTDIKLGYAVTGTAHPGKILTLATAQPGDKLVLTKALGTGIVTAAYKADACPEDLFKAACAGMVELNDAGRDGMLEVGAHAAVAVKGCGLAGSAVAMAEASKATLVLELSELPLLPGAEKLARKPYLTRGSTANAADVAAAIRKEGGKPDPARLEFLYDPQTSGGLLISVPAGEADILVQKCRGRGALAANIVGEVVEREDVALILRP